MELFGGQQREAVVEMEAHLVAEHAAGAGSCTVLFLNTIVEHILQKVKILFHKVIGALISIINALRQK